MGAKKVISCFNGLRIIFRLHQIKKPTLRVGFLICDGVMEGTR